MKKKYYDSFQMKIDKHSNYHYITMAECDTLQILSGFLEEIGTSYINIVIDSLFKANSDGFSVNVYNLRKYEDLSVIRLELDDVGTGRDIFEEGSSYDDYNYGVGYRDTVENMLKFFKEWKEIKSKPYPQIVTLYQEYENGPVKINAIPEN